MTSHRKTKTGGAVTATSRAETGTITIESGKGGVLTAIELIVFPTLETVVNSGGLVELENDAVDWKPFEFYTQGQTCVDAGGSKAKPLRIPVHKELPADSTVTIYYTPQDNQSQKLCVTLHWETGMSFNPSEETLAKSGIGSAITQVTIAADHVTIDIPAKKGGKIKAFMIQVFPTLETVVNSGGLVALKNRSATPSWEPFDFFTQLQTCVTEGGTELEALFIPADLDLPSNSKVQLDYTPLDNQSQLLALVVIWNRR